MNKELSHKLESVTTRIETLLHIGGMVTDCDSMPEVLREMLGEQDDKQLSQLFPNIPKRVIEALDDDDLSEFAEWVHLEGRLGFLVQFATPVMRHYAGAKTYSWGYYRTHWFYGETLQQATERGLEWAAECRAKEPPSPTP